MEIIVQNCNEIKSIQWKSVNNLIYRLPVGAIRRRIVISRNVC